MRVLPFAGLCALFLLSLFGPSLALRPNICALSDMPEKLPNTLNSLSYLQPNKEFHLHGEFYVNFSNSHEIFFDLAEESAFRIYIAPHGVWDIDLYLYSNESSVPIDHSGLDLFSEEVIASILPKGSYRVVFNFLFGWSDSKAEERCETLVMELSIVPKARVLQRVAQYECAPQEEFPVIDFSTINDVNGFVFNSTKTFNVNTTLPISPGPKYKNLRMVKAYNFTLPSAKGSTGLWRIEATLGYDFLTGGSLGLLLDFDGNTVETNIDCANTLFSHFSDERPNCTLGTADIMNEIKLRWIVETNKLYTLWIYDVYGENNRTLFNCIPFTFRLNIEPIVYSENLLTCEAPRIPTSLNEPGLLSSTGYINYAEHVFIDLSKIEHNINFIVSTKSLFRVFIEQHRVDIDLRLKLGDTVIASSLLFNKQESIIASLEPGNYTLNLKYFGVYDVVFCETFQLRIALAPKEFAYTECPSAASAFPSLGAMSDMVSSFNSSFQFYSTPVTNPAQRQIIVKQTFTLNGPSEIRAIAGINFLLGDLELAISLERDSRVTKIYAEHTRDMLVMHEILLPGVYEISLSTATVKTSPSIAGFPNCIPYSFMLDIQPQADQSSNNCWVFTNVPLALSTADFIKFPETHIQGSFLVPRTRPGQILVSEEIPFTVKQISQFRAFTEPHSIDIDLHLSENGVTVVSSIAGVYNEEEIAYMVQPNKNYKLVIQYYASPLGSSHCSVFDFEMAISPKIQSPSCLQILPSDDWIPSPPTPPSGSMLWLSEGIWAFNDASPLLKRWMFNITEPYVMRATVASDFIYANLALRILRVDNSTPPQYTSIGHAETFYDREEMRIELPTGRYALELQESLSVFATTHCLPFKIRLGFAPLKTVIDDVIASTDYIGCHDYPLPSNFNDLTGISAFSGEQLHFERNVIVNVKSRNAWVDFHVNSPSAIRLYVPSLPTIDVDIIIYQGTAKNPGNSLVSLVQYGEESVALKLTAGDYAIKFNYYGMRHIPLPPMSECTSYPFELAIIPLSILEAIPQITDTVCTEHLPQNVIQPAQPFNDTFQFKHVANFEHRMTFNLTSAGKISVDLGYNFISGGLSLELKGRISEGSSFVDRSYFGKVGMSHAFLYQSLHKGNYTLIIRDPSKWEKSGLSTLPCTQFQLSYLLQTSTPISNDCDDVYQLPRDLFSANGGSVGMGGPQSSDGSVRIYSRKLLIPKDTPIHSYIQFNIVQKSFIRIFSVAEQGNDIDFYVYRNMSNTWPLLWFNGVDDVESGLGQLDPQATPYFLDVSFFRNNKEKPCNYYQFGVEISPVDRTYASIACPVLLPYALTTSVTCSANRPVDIHGIYYFTNYQMDQGTSGGTFKYRITLDVRDPTLLYTEINFDFLTNHFMLMLSNSNGTIIRRGTSGMLEVGGSEHLDFFNSIEFALQPGQYFLDIVENLARKELRTNNTHCYKFSFVLNAFSERVPHVVSVSPPEGNNINPLDNLVISVTFSESVGFPSSDQIQSHVLDNQLAYLKTTGSDRPSPGSHDHPKEDGNINLIPPDAVSFFRARSVLFLTWNGPLLTSQTYELVFNLSSLTAGDGRNFSNAVQSGRLYVTAGYDCNGHGSPNPNITDKIVCICVPPYTGDHCTRCMDGFHGEGRECVRNIPCNDDSCNKHGRCSDGAGYPSCACYPGYATIGNNFCSACASGYEGYPDCVPIPPPFEEGTRCKATLLPSTFDDNAYLGFDGEMRMYGRYFIDPLRKEHDITFNLKEQSLLRVHLAPHWVDVDIWVYKQTGNEITWITHGGLAISKEESLVVTLNKTEVHESYLLKLRYYMFSSNRPDCETINLDISIVTIAKLSARVNNMETTCRNILSSANKGLPPNDMVTVPKDGYAYNPTTMFALDYSRFAKPPPSDSRIQVGPVYFWNMTFIVPKAPEGKVAVLHAEVAFRFDQAIFSLMVVPGANSTYCELFGTANSKGCVTGTNLYNKNVLDIPVSTGENTLWIYAPRMPFVSCTLFDFSWNVEFRDQGEDTFACKGARFPYSLNEPNYLHESGTLHTQDNYILDVAHERVHFQLAVPSYFRLAASADLVLGFEVFLFDRSTATPQLIYQSSKGAIFERLNPGKYAFEVMVFDQLIGIVCPMMSIEIQIVPAVQINLNPDFCGNTNPRDKLPQLPPTLGETPFVFNSSVNDWFYTFRTCEIVSYPMNLQQSMRIVAQADSAFMASDIRIEIMYDESPNQDNSQLVRKRGKPLYNQNVLDRILAAGRYTLILSRPHPRVSVPLPNCAPFDFKLSLLPVNIHTCYGEEVPSSLQILRFLTTEKNINYHSSSWMVPEGNLRATRDITFTVDDESLFRVYTEPHYIDIDLKLWETKDGKETQVDAGKNGFYNEEVIAHLLKADIQYRLEIIFWKWHPEEIPPCPVFNMEFSVQQTALIRNGTACLSGDHWPPEFPKDMPAKPYYYDSTNPTGKEDEQPELLYFHQTVDAPKSKTYTFTLTDTTDFYASVSYDFSLGDLVLKLTNKETGIVYWGENDYNRNSISELNLVVGTYTLDIYEPPVEENPSRLVCAFFTFHVVVVRGGINTLMDLAHPLLPTSLNELPYLYADGSVHLQQRYSLFTPTIKHREIAFTLKSDSEMRVSATLDTDAANVGFLLKKKSDGALVLSGNNGIYGSVLAGDYVLNLDFAPKNPWSIDMKVISALELAIRPQEELKTVLKNFQKSSSCKRLEEELFDHGINKSNFIVIGGNGPSEFQFRSTLAAIGSEHVQREQLLGNISFMIMEDTVIYAKLGFNFLFDQLQLRIRGINVPDSQFPYEGVYGESVRNINQLNKLITPGKYSLTVSLTTPSNLWNQRPPLCVPFSFGVYAETIGDGHEHIDCFDYDLLPWDLEDPLAGSQRFGGPMVDGYVHINGNRFLFLQQNDNAMVFSVKEKSMLSIFVSVADKWQGRTVAIRVVNKGKDGRSETVLTPINTNGTLGQRLDLYILEPNNVKTIFEVQVLKTTSAPFYGSCPYFTFDLIVDKYQRVQESLVCDTKSLPDKSPKVDERGIIASYVQGNMAYSDMQKYMTGNNFFVYPIKFEVKERAVIDVGMAFSSLTNVYGMELERESSNWLIPVESRFFQGTTNVGRTNILQRLSGLLAPNNYTLNIIQQKFAVFQQPQYCYPFVWDFALVPENVPYIQTIIPEGGIELPWADLALQIFFSTEIYNKDGVLINAVIASTLNSAFQLQKDTNIVTAKSVRFITTSLLEVLFAKEQLKVSVEYNLVLVENTLFNKDHKDFVNPTHHIYSISPRGCHGHGNYNDTTKKCDCDKGYTGTDCNKCAPGYVAKNTSDSSLVCVLDESICHTDTCGCLNQDDKTCTPLGICEVVEGIAKCKCGPAFGGLHCEKCAEGYVEYPNCRKMDDCNPHCVNGDCDAANNKCICMANWHGSPICDKCTEGWSGLDCKTFKSEDEGGFTGFLKFITIVSVVVIGIILLGAGAWFIWSRHKSARRRRGEEEFGFEMRPYNSPLNGDGEYDDDFGYVDNSLNSRFDDDGGQDNADDAVIDNDFNPRASDKSASQSLLDL